MNIESGAEYIFRHCKEEPQSGFAKLIREETGSDFYEANPKKILGFWFKNSQPLSKQNKFINKWNELCKVYKAQNS